MSVEKLNNNSYTQQVLSEIENSTWDGDFFQVSDGEYIVELDEEDAFARWGIQPKSCDSVDDLRIIYEHNRKVLNTFRKLGIHIEYVPFFEGDAG